MPNRPSKERLLSLIPAFSALNITLWADLVVDHYIYGLPKRISREAPVLILRFEEEWMKPGGGANTFNNILALGSRPTLVGAVGDDFYGAYLKDLCRDNELDTSFLTTTQGSTLSKVRILAGPRSGVKQQVVRYDHDTRFTDLHLPLPDLADGDFLLVSDYGYGTVDPSRVREAAANGVPVIVDSRFRLDAFNGVRAVTPNEEEAEALLGHAITGEAEALQGAQSLRRRLEVEVVLLTRGSKGMVVADETGAVSFPVVGGSQVADVTGAGDTVLASFSLALAAGATPVEAAFLANCAAGVVVMKSGTAVCTVTELEGVIRDHAG